MRIFLAILWAAAIFLFTCTQSLNHLMETYSASFVWTTTPNLIGFFSALPTETGQDFWIQKAGHIAAFFIFTCLLIAITNSIKITLVLAIGYACLTEVLQLYFNRDGRLFDVGFDSLGIIAALLLVGIKLIVATAIKGNYIKRSEKTH